MKTKTRRGQSKKVPLVRYLVLIFMSSFVIAPLLWMLSTAFKPEPELYYPEPKWFPENFTLDSFTKFWEIYDFGTMTLNSLITSLGGTAITWNYSQFWMVFWIVVYFVWQRCGPATIIWLGGLQGIDPSLYEAARVDGAGVRQCFRFITLPSLLPTLGLTAILSLLSSFKVFREAYLVAGPYPHASIYLLQHLFNNWFQNLDISRLCAAAVLLAMILAGIILLMQRFFSAKDA